MRTPLKNFTTLGFSFILGVALFVAPPTSVRAQSSKKSAKPDPAFESERQAEKKRLRMTSGEDVTIDLSFVPTSANAISVGNPQVVTASLVIVGEKRQITFKPIKAGETSVSVRDQDGNIKLIYTVVVTGSNLLRRAEEIRGLLRDVEGIDVKIVGQKLVVDGEVLVPMDYARILTVITDKMYADQVLNLTVLSPVALQYIAKKIQEDVGGFAPDVTTRVVNGVIFLEGSVDSYDKAKRAFEIAKLYIPDARPAHPLKEASQDAQVMDRRALVQNFILVTAPPPKKQEKLVRVTAHFVKLAKDYKKVFGFKWQPGVTSDNASLAVGNTGDGAVGASGTSLTATIFNLFPKLQSAQNAGYARVLKTGTLIVKSSENATLNETTEFPYQGIDQNGRAAEQFVKVGLTLTVSPKILGQSEDIELNLQVKQVSIASAGRNGRAPSTATHDVSTKIYVRSQESAAVAGVNSADVSTAFNKDDPREGTFEQNSEPLFTLLRSKNYSKTKSQFVIFITPEIIDNASEGTQDLKRNFRVKVN